MGSTIYTIHYDTTHGITHLYNTLRCNTWDQCFSSWLYFQSLIRSILGDFVLQILYSIKHSLKYVGAMFNLQLKQVLKCDTVCPHDNIIQLSSLLYQNLYSFIAIYNISIYLHCSVRRSSFLEAVFTVGSIMLFTRPFILITVYLFLELAIRVRFRIVD